MKRIKSSRFVSQAASTRKPSKFEQWFIDCLQVCINDESYPDYKWDLNNCKLWRERFKIGLTPLEAVNIHFKSH